MLPTIRHLVRRRRVLGGSLFPASLHAVASPNRIFVAEDERTECFAVAFSQVCFYGVLNEGSNRQIADDNLDSADSTRTSGLTGSDYYKFMEISEILESKPWGTHTQELLEKSYAPFNTNIVTKVIATTTSDAALKLFNWLPCKGFEHNAETYRALINSLGAAGQLRSMREFVEEMCKAGKSPNIDLYGRLIHWCVRYGDTAGGIGFFDKMKQGGIELDVSTYTNMFDLRAREGQYEEAISLYLQMVEEGISPSSWTCAVLTRHLLNVGKLESAYTVFTILSDLKVKPSMWTYAYLMAAYAKVGNSLMLHKLGRELRDSYSRPGKMFCAAVESLLQEGKRKEADSFAGVVWPELSVNERRLKIQESQNVTLGREMEDEDQWEDLRKLAASFKVTNGQEQSVSNVPFQKIHLSSSDFAGLLETAGLSVLEKVTVDWTDDAVHLLLRQLSNSDVALEFFQWVKACPGFRHDIYNEIYMLRMLARDRKVSALKELLIDIQGSSNRLPLSAFNDLIKDFGYAKNARAALWTFNRIKESNLQANEETFRLLVHVLARDKNPEKALELLGLMETLGIKLDTETYTAVIHSLGLARKSGQAWSVYQKMLTSGLMPDAYTYTVLLNIMNLVGDTEFAINLYKEMNDGGIAPTALTIGIMSKVWRKSGNLVEFQKLEMQRKFLASKKREDSLQHIYEILQENLVEQEQSSSLLF